MLILFDIDDTLVDHSSAFRAATLALHQQAGVSAAMDDFFATWAVAHRRHFDRYLVGELSYAQQGRARIRDAIDPGASDQTADAMFATYIASYEEAWRLFPDVIPCLDSLREHQLGVISNGQAHQQRKKLDRTEIADRFGCVVISEECGHAKPAAEIFLRACSAAGVSPQRTIYVGDLYDLDAEAARRAGLVGVWLDRLGQGTADQRPPRICSLDDLKGVVDVISAPPRGTAAGWPRTQASGA